MQDLYDYQYYTFIYVLQKHLDDIMHVYIYLSIECFKIWGFFSAAILSLMNTPNIFIHIPLMCKFNQQVESVHNLL